MDKVIAIDIDNVLNDFNAVLRNIEFPYDKNDSNSEESFMQNLDIIKQQKVVPAESYYDKAFTAMRDHAHKLAHRQAKVKQGASEFLWYLKQNDHRIIIMTHRDLRYALEYTKDFLKNNHLPYDYIFHSNVQAVTCSLWNIPVLIDGDFEPGMLSNSLSNPVQVYYPIMDKHKGLAEEPQITAIGYNYFKELQEWIK